MKACIYVRVSTTDKQDYTRQIEDLTIVANHDGYSDNIDIYADKISGYSKNAIRPQLTSMLERLEEYNIVYVTEISRLGRKPSEVRKVIDHISDLKIPIYIHQYKQRTITDDGRDNIVLSIIMNVLIDIGNQEAETLKERSKSGLLSSAKKGHAGGGATLAYGYYRGDDKMLIPHPAEAEIVRLIFKMYSEGIGSKKISNELNFKKIPTKLQNTSVSKVLKFKGNIKNVDEIRWGDKQIQEILANTIYKGERKYKDIVISVEPIVTPELFDECTYIRQTKTHRNYLTVYDYLLKDLLICGCCGRNYFGRYKPSPNGDKIYMCSSRLKNNNRCINIGVNITYLESSVYDLLIASKILLGYINNKNDLLVSVETQIVNLEFSLKQETLLFNQKENEIERVLDFYFKGMITEEQFTIRQNKLKNVISNISNSITILKASIAESKNLLKKINETNTDADFIDKISSNRIELKTIFKQFIKKIILTNLENNQLLVDIYLIIEGRVRTSIKMILDLSIPKMKKNLVYSYWYHGGIDLEYNDNILVTKSDEILKSFAALPNAFFWIIAPHNVIKLNPAVNSKEYSS